MRFLLVAKRVRKLSGYFLVTRHAPLYPELKTHPSTGD
jgi:hypothetical protein